VTARNAAAGAAGLAVAAGFARLARRYADATAQADRSWKSAVAAPLSDLGAVDEVSILPVVERFTAGAALAGEAGVSYLIRAGRARILFDCGLSGGRDPSALVRNAQQLDVDLSNLDAVVISHLHPDHVGGIRAVRGRTFTFTRGGREPLGVPAHVPTAMRHERADVVPTDGPRVIAQGVAVLPPLPRALFWLGPTSEQALVINVRGFGLVVVTGCGHPPIERILGVSEQVLDVPIAGVVGGLHLPVHAFGTALIPQAVLGHPNWPWQPVREQDVLDVLDVIDERGPRLVALSGHDSTPWTLDAFASRFGDRYRTLRVGEEVRVGDAEITALPGNA
jgi:7,8-dihydropterin-6-yl-methyl-4-(beta-D-ribofuranosyl)aminobenzene 5'-phosphate synthase